MFIKQVIITGFQSYRDRTVIEPFHEGHNVIVGRNGSGKSNFFNAIQFVLSNEFSNLKVEQRQQLLHDGSGQRTFSASVEIIFDNTDNRFPLDMPEVSLMRVIGPKDLHYLNRKVVTRLEVTDLLESVGLSKSNPYYIVKQGKINQMATAPDSERLKLLREIAGTRVYDERKNESEAILKLAKKDMDTINEFLLAIEERLSVLEEEKEELSEYQRLDKRKRMVESRVYDMELKESKHKWKQWQEILKEVIVEERSLRMKAEEAKCKVKVTAQELKVAKKRVRSIEEAREAVTAEIQSLIKDRTKLELTIKDLSEDAVENVSGNEKIEEELREIEETIRDAQRNLDEVTPLYEKAKMEEEKYAKDLSLLERKRQEFCTLRGQKKQFKTKDERDVWIGQQMNNLTERINEKTAHKLELQNGIEQDAKRREDLEMSIRRKMEELGKVGEHIRRLSESLHEGKREKYNLQAKRNDLWREESELVENLNEAKENLAKEEQRRRWLVGRSVYEGQKSVAKVLDMFRERGGAWLEMANQYYGQVIENFDCDDMWLLAVEVTAGYRLFHHIVSTDQIGTAILREMNQQRLPGEVTFMPINRLKRPMDPKYPASAEVIPMLRKMNYEPRVAVIMKYIFGNTMICRNLNIATALTRCRLDFVTIQGDQASSRGTLTGGHYSRDRSKLEVQRMRDLYAAKVMELEELLQKTKHEITLTENAINNLLLNTSQIETKLGQTTSNMERAKSELNALKEELANVKKFEEGKAGSMAQCSSDIQDLLATREILQSESRQEWTPDQDSQLGTQDETTLQSLNANIKSLTELTKQSFKSRMQQESKKRKLENLLANTLFRRRDELAQSLMDMSVKNRSNEIESLRAELARVKSRLAGLLLSEKNFNEDYVMAIARRNSLRDALEEKRAIEKNTQEAQTLKSEELIQLRDKCQTLAQKVEEYQGKLQSLAAIVPNENISKMSLRSLYADLKVINSYLEEYRCVNKKAMDQFLTLSDHKEQLLARKEEMDRGNEKILELMMVLEQKKREAVQFTFKQVSMFFESIFKRLVPQGFAELVMQRAHSDRDSSSPEECIDDYKGVGIRVSFTGHEEMKDLNQLSGGQKSLVALSVIFAIQMCDSAPFYLFDEIDQALDPEYREKVANLIKERSEKAQFIVTTFRPELLVVADKFYGVTFENNVSHVRCVCKEDALDFVEYDGSG